jgi:hypothetical protein
MLAIRGTYDSVGKCDKKNEYEIKLRNDNPFT